MTEALPHTEARLFDLMTRHGLQRWIGVVATLLSRAQGLEQVTETPPVAEFAAAVEQCAACDNGALRDTLLAKRIARLDLFTFQAVTPKSGKRWHILEQALRDFSRDAGGDVIYWQGCEPEPAPAAVEGWIAKHLPSPPCSS